MIEILQTIPVLRIFDEAKAREFYCGWLGCTVEFEHRFEPAAPLLSLYFPILEEMEPSR